MFVIDWIIVNWIQVVGVLTGAGSVYFLAKDKPVPGWTLGIINAAFFMVLMYHERLYADFTLNFYYFFFSAVGLYWWTRRKSGSAVVKVKRPITRLGWKGYALTALIVAVGTAAFGTFLREMTIAEFVYIDSFTTVLSFVGQYLLARKIFDNWYVWILADLIDVVLYAIKGLWLVSALTVVMGVLCVVGIKVWTKIERDEKEEAADLGLTPDALMTARVITAQL